MRRIGRYQLVTRLASGTLGDVFLAQAEKENGEPAIPRFAIKLIKNELALDPRIARLVLIEGQTAIHFSHPVAVRIHEAERDGGELYISTDLIGGQALSSVLKKLRVDSNPLDHRLICHVGAEIASVLAKAHELNWFSGSPGKFLHATLAPKRILLGYEGETQLLGLGWGRARLTQPLGMATLPYASPEVAAGREPSPRSDVYSLATVLYYAFSGRPIFRRGDEEETRAAIREANAPTLNSASLSVDPSIGDLLAEMMAPRIEARPESMAAIETKLRAAAGLSRDEASGMLAKVMQAAFAEDADAFRRQTKAATRAAQEPKRKIPPREESRLAETPAVIWSSDEVSAETMVPMLAESQVTEPDRPPPTRGRIARYVIERPMSRSGSTSVYACRDPNVARPLIVKILDPAQITDPRLARSEWIRLFKNEARIAGRVRHEGFPILHDAGRDEGAYFIAMESLPGETLQALQGRGAKLAPAQVKSIGIDLARALHHMHQLGLVHADVKASNVLIGEDGRARLIDFSLASYVEGPQHPLIQTNLAVASPEVLDGQAYAPQAEQFALGALLYELLVGARPFRGVEDPDLVHAIRSSEPKPPESLDGGVDANLSEVCMRMLEKEPGARFPSMLAVAEHLEDLTAPHRSVLEQDTEPMIPRAAFTKETPPQIGSRPDDRDLIETVIRICERVSTLSAPDFVNRAISDAPAAARSVARRLGLGEEAQTRAALSVAIRDLADRARLSIQSEEMVSLIPRQVADLVLAVDRVGDDGESDPVPQVVSLVEAYFRATRPRDGRPRSSPRRAVLDLKAQVGSRYSNEIVEALVEHLREVVSALDLAPQQPDAPRILLAGVPSDALVHALEFDGFAIDAAADGHSAWEKLRKDPFSGAIVDAALPGRDALSLLKLCRAHPDTARIAFLILGHEGPPSELDGVAVLERTAALDSIRSSLRSLIAR